jgi:hypothetical protein
MVSIPKPLGGERVTVKRTVWTMLDDQMLLSNAIQSDAKKLSFSCGLTIEWE